MPKPTAELSNWPPDTGPDGADVFAHNERRIGAAPEQVWRQLTAASQWSRWYRNAWRVQLPAGLSQLQPDVVFSWTTFGTHLTSQVVHFSPPYRLGWIWRCPGAFGYHGWLLEPTAAGTRVVTEETQRGPKIVRWGWLLRPLLRLAHAYWLRQLERRVRRTGAHNPRVKT